MSTICASSEQCCDVTQSIQILWLLLPFYNVHREQGFRLPSYIVSCTPRGKIDGFYVFFLLYSMPYVILLGLKLPENKLRHFCERLCANFGSKRTSFIFSIRMFALYFCHFRVKFLSAVDEAFSGHLFR